MTFEVTYEAAWETFTDVIEADDWQCIIDKFCDSDCWLTSVRLL